MSPVPLHAILWGYVLGGVIRGLFVAIIVSAMSLFCRPLYYQLVCDYIYSTHYLAIILSRRFY